MRSAKIPKPISYDEIKSLQSDRKIGMVANIKIDPRELAEIINILGLHERGLAGLTFLVVDDNMSCDSKVLFNYLRKEKGLRTIDVACIFYGLVREKHTPDKNDNCIHVTMEQLNGIRDKYMKSFKINVHAYQIEKKRMGRGNPERFFNPQPRISTDVPLPNPNGQVAYAKAPEVNKILISSRIDNWLAEDVLRVVALMPEKETGVPASLLEEFFAEAKILGGIANV